MKNNTDNSILLIDKPKGITSFDVIRILRKKLGIRKMGHAGTLDPMASGLMIIGIQSGTKRLNDYLKLPKVYYAEILLGQQTDTGDLEGEVVEEKPVVKKIEEREIEDALQKFIGAHEFAVPLYSAVKVDGRPLYAYARAGQTPPRIPVKQMTVTDISLLDHYTSGSHMIIKVRIAVSSGTYIRVLAEEIGKALGYPATLKNLRRTQIGDVTLEDAQFLDDEICYTGQHMTQMLWENININIKATDIDLDQRLRDYVEKRVTKLGTLLQKEEGEVFAYFEVAKTTDHHQKGDIYRADCRIEFSGQSHYVSAEAEDILSAIDAVKEKLYREIRNHKSKQATLLKRGGRALKRLMRFGRSE